MNEIEIPAFLMPPEGSVWQTVIGDIYLITAVTPDRVYYKVQGRSLSMPCVRWLDMEALEMFKRV